jgi:hypothetical protein
MFILKTRTLSALLSLSALTISTVYTRDGVCNSVPDVSKQVKFGLLVLAWHKRYGRVNKTRPAWEGSDWQLRFTVALLFPK